MSKLKLGKSADDIFAPKPLKQEVTPVGTIAHKIDAKEPAEAPEITSVKRSRGRPQEHTQCVSKVTVVLLDSQIHWLDQLASEIRLKTKAAVSRAELIRAAIGAIEESKVDLSNVGSEQAIKDTLLEKLKR